MIIVFARQLNHLCRNTQSWHKKKLLHSDLWMPTFVQQDLWKAMSAAGIAAMKRCFPLNGTYITETVPWAAPLRACGLPDAVFLAISATSACRDLHLEGEEGGGKRRFSSTAPPPVPEAADSSSVNVSLLRPRHHGKAGMHWGFSAVVLDHVCPHSFPLTREGRCFWHSWKQARLCQSPRAWHEGEADRQTSFTLLPAHLSCDTAAAAAWPTGQVIGSQPRDVPWGHPVAALRGHDGHWPETTRLRHHTEFEVEED